MDDIAIERVTEWINHSLITFDYKRTLDLSYLQLTQLPTLPDKLQYLLCDNNELTELPTLPTNLKLLYCDNNLLTSLPSLPINLEKLLCGNNPLTNLPSLPSTLVRLSCFNCNINFLKLPDALEVLNITIDEIDFTFKNMKQYYLIQKLKEKDKLKNLNFESVISHTIRKYV